MKWIDSTDLRNWADRRSCQETLPLLVRKLIRATSKTIKSIKFPSGESVLLGGWDGVLEVTEETEYFPSGVSLWEFGTSKDPKGKADDDFEKRTVNPLGYNPTETTFIFVTPRLWQNGEDWAKEKMKDRIWKDIRVINSEILEEWIEIAPTVGAWLAKKEYIGKYPSEGIQPSDDFWEEWISGTKFKLNAEILLGGRKNEQEKIIESFITPSILAVEGISKEESLAFIISCFKDNLEKEEDFFSRSIIVDSVNAFRELTVHDKPLILIPRFEDIGVVNRAIQKGHTVIFPLGVDSSNNWSNKIVLPKIERESFVNALISTGMTKEFAERFSKESARNITILRRQLEFERTRPLWAFPENVSEIIPALIVGRWDENFENDKIIISKIAGDTYENYSKKLTKWLHTHDSPIVKIGCTWRLTSPFDVWTNASINLTRHDFDLLHQSAIEIISEINPAFELPPDQRHMASIYGKKREFSDWIREGVIQSLILTSIFGDKLKFDLPFKAEVWVDRIIAELLNSDHPEMWKSLEDKLPLIAEASPKAFLDAVEKNLVIKNSPIAALFEEDSGFLTPRSYHTGLLWALENLAWLPQYLSRASLILSQLSAIDPGGRLSNRPINSLSEIFKSWHYQTLASYDERMQVLKLISERQPEIAWIILIRMLPDPFNTVGQPTHKMRWRMFELQTEKPITYKEVYDTHSAVVEMLISIFDFTESKFSTLIEQSVNLSPSDRDKLLTFVEKALSELKQVEYKVWHTVRKILAQHRSHPDFNWALPENELYRFQKLYELLMPKDEIDLMIWMFNENWPAFPEGYQYERLSRDEQEKFIFDKRVEALKNIYENHGLGKIIELADTVKEPWVFGNTLGYIVSDEDELIKLFEILRTEKAYKPFVQSFISRKSTLNGLDWVMIWFEKLKAIGFNNSELVKLLIPLPQTQKLWDFIESKGEDVIKGYWKNVYPHFYRIEPNEKIFGLKKLIEHKRFLSAIHICSHFVDEIPSDIIVEILQKAGSEKSDENVRVEGYEVTRLFESIDKRNDVEANTLIQLEWLFFPVLTSSNNKHKPKRLHEELSRNPFFFMDVLKLIYKPDDESKFKDEKNTLTEEQLQNRAVHAYELLNSWKKIPGIDEKNEVDYYFLTGWVEKARELGIEYGRLNIVDVYIGKVLAQYPEESEKPWPSNEICELLETTNSDSMMQGFSTATHNKRSFSSRGTYEGGDIERIKAGYYSSLWHSHKNKFPMVAKIFERLSNKYLEEAKIMDEEAERSILEH